MKALGMPPRRICMCGVWWCGVEGRLIKEGCAKDCGLHRSRRQRHSVQDSSETGR